MWGSAAFHAGIVTFLVGLGFTVKPVPRLRVRSRRRALAIAAGGALLAAGALNAPACDAQVRRPSNALDAFIPAWQFHEVHTHHVPAPPARVFEAIKRVRADEILLFQALTWIRRGGRSLPPGILNAGSESPIVDVATKGGFVVLADDAPRELVLGAIVARPPGGRLVLTRERFREPFPPGYALAAMNFRIIDDGAGGSIVSTETRVHATSPAVRRRFAAYWRVIYPGSALIRRMWLRAIARRAREAPRRRGWARRVPRLHP